VFTARYGLELYMLCRISAESEWLIIHVGERTRRWNSIVDTVTVQALIGSEIRIAKSSLIGHFSVMI